MEDIQRKQSKARPHTFVVDIPVVIRLRGACGNFITYYFRCLTLGPAVHTKVELELPEKESNSFESPLFWKQRTVTVCRSRHSTAYQNCCTLSPSFSNPDSSSSLILLYKIGHFIIKVGARLLKDRKNIGHITHVLWYCNIVISIMKRYEYDVQIDFTPGRWLRIVRRPDRCPGRLTMLVWAKHCALRSRSVPQ